MLFVLSILMIFLIWHIRRQHRKRMVTDEDSIDCDTHKSKLK